MFDKIKNTATKNLKNEGIEVETALVSETPDGGMSAKLRSMGEGVRNAGADFASKAKELNVFDKVKSFTSASVKTVEEIDAHLLATRSPYEINNFRVSSTAGVTAGMTLDIHFIKTAGAREVASAQSKYLVVVNPSNGNKIKVPVTALTGRDTAKVKDPDTGEVLEFSTKTGAVIVPS
ncbi:MAG: hypothetical protein HWE20_12120 [Gammaproteobacteria bacterium]|nr:hypothetical protein [Gammaproteobacteria bacterium]